MNTRENSQRAPFLAISYGTIAFHHGKHKLPNPEHTHRWTLFLRGAYNQDISYAIKKVVFQLHRDYENYRRGAFYLVPGAFFFCLSDGVSRASPLPSIITPNNTPPILFSPTPRPAEVTAPPYLVSETGWGGFDTMVEIHLRDPTLPPIILPHYLKLYTDGGPPVPGGLAAALEKPVLSEHYDELVFNALPSDPTLAAALVAGPTRDAPPYPHQEHFTVHSSEQDLMNISVGRKWLADRVEELEERLSKAKAATATLRHLHLAT